MPASGVPALTPNSKLLTTNEIIRLATIFVKECGVEKIRLTGGEPTVRRDLVDIIDGLNQLRPHGLTSIGMTTNGLALKSKLPQLKEAGLDHLNISLDTMSPHMFELLTRRRGHQSVVESIYAALDTGFKSVKLNNVIMNGVNDHEVVDFVELTRNNDLYVRFIEYMPFDGNQWSNKKFVPYKTSLSQITKFFNGIEITKASDDPNDTSKAYKLAGFKGKFGFITSMSEHFCSTCSRVRLLADGNLKVCLFGNSEVNLRDVLRSGSNVPDEEVIRVIEEAVRRKKKQHAGMENLAKMENRPMVLIGVTPSPEVTPTVAESNRDDSNETVIEYLPSVVAVQKSIKGNPTQPPIGENSVETNTSDGWNDLKEKLPSLPLHKDVNSGIRLSILEPMKKLTLFYAKFCRQSDPPKSPADDWIGEILKFIQTSDSSKVDEVIKKFFDYLDNQHLETLLNGFGSLVSKIPGVPQSFGDCIKAVANAYEKGSGRGIRREENCVSVKHFATSLWSPGEYPEQGSKTVPIHSQKTAENMDSTVKDARCRYEAIFLRVKDIADSSVLPKFHLKNLRKFFEIAASNLVRPASVLSGLRSDLSDIRIEIRDRVLFHIGLISDQTSRWV
ncbi:UNVERIFIED_CONTAM: Molybdenum cofactor synthesis protein 1 [Siphonaria sp. JEL0065]|nr:Molybdenum cofactor synthesis protein 1 [Siphonaria sp. JEL0065]